MEKGINSDGNASLPDELASKIEQTKKLLGEALNRYGSEHLAIAITGGKDSTLALWLLRETCLEINCSLPKCLFIDEGDVFDEIYEIVKQLESDWSLNIVRMKNNDVADKVQELYQEISVSDLNEMNRKEIEAIDFTEPSFPFEPESYVGNHLMKTVPMKQFLVDNSVKGLMTAIRRDEQDARVSETHFSPRENPDHMRIHPILHFDERDVWDLIHHFKIPFCKLYYQGYRSLGAKSSTGKVSDIPAWEQDLENTTERSGRASGKEQIMEKLRELGYM